LNDLWSILLGQWCTTSNQSCPASGRPPHVDANALDICRLGRPPGTPPLGPSARGRLPPPISKCRFLDVVHTFLNIHVYLIQWFLNSSSTSKSDEECKSYGWMKFSHENMDSNSALKMTEPSKKGRSLK
jgi:hypothetical protein